jgi:hypothetical protein
MGFIYWAVITGVYNVAKAATVYCREHNVAFVDSRTGKFIAYFCCIGFTLLLSYSMAMSLGTHIEEDDPRRSSGFVIVDYYPTDKERQERGVGVFFTVIIPALVGVYNAYKLPIKPLSKY